MAKKIIGPVLLAMVVPLMGYGQGDFRPSVSSKEYQAVREARLSGDKSAFVRAISNILSKDGKNLKALNALAAYHIEKKNFELARLIIDRALVNHPNSESLYNSLGVVELGQGDEKAAMGHFLRSLRKKSGYEVAATNLGSIYLKYKDYKRSLTPLEDGHLKTKDGLSKGVRESVYVANNFAVALKGVGEPRTAKKIYDRIFSGDSSDSQVYLNYAILLVEVLKDRKEALRAVSKLRFITEDPKILKELKRLEEKADQLK